MDNMIDPTTLRAFQFKHQHQKFPWEKVIDLNNNRSKILGVDSSYTQLDSKFLMVKAQVKIPRENIVDLVTMEVKYIVWHPFRPMNVSQTSGK